MLDFNHEEEQRTRNYGPVPGGSIVFIKLIIEKPKYSAPTHQFVSISRNGMLGLWCKFEVTEGTYAGCHWYDNLWLPKGSQNITLHDGQTTACNMSGARMRAIIEASRGVSAKDDSPQASRKRQISDWLDLSGMEFPARVGISKEPYEKDGKTYWSNCILMVITPDKKEYPEVRRLGEIINENGPTTYSEQGSGNGNGRTGGSGKGNARSAGAADDPGYEQPPIGAYGSDIPF